MFLIQLQSALVALGATIAAAVPALEARGNQFVNPKTNDVFQIVGMAYQIGGSAGYDPSHGKDPLSNGDVCKRDAAIMQVLGINTIRVYNLDPNLNHDECASIFNAAGMYMVIDVNSPLVGESLNSLEPWTSYYDTYLNRTFAIVEAFKSYPNLLGFFSGNEVISNVKQGGTAPPYIRAVTRDLKQYIKNHADRPIPVGYSAADVRDVLEDSWNYFQCSIEGEEDDMSRADMFALNSYSWCADASFESSGYNTLVDMFKSSSVPVFYSEFGCNTPSPIGTIYGKQMTPVFSGGVVYEFAQEPNNYGLAEVNKDDSVKLLSDFKSLKDQYAKVDWKAVQSVKANGNSVKAPKCSTGLIKEKGFNNNFTLPALPPTLRRSLTVPVGKIVKVSDYKVTHEVQDTDGKAITGLAIKPLADDVSNTAGSNNAATGSGSSSSPSQSGDGKSAGFRSIAISGAAAGISMLAFLAVSF
ncbi:glycolipid anchored surface protein [Apiospora kogelbergensis]|uniref:1,3-beta-glucanosyltransferase n=1 Tax=Apiospora kogelbergensis TaxID=1337665 RepID=A0AAW0R7J8_9PEZI